MFQVLLATDSDEDRAIAGAKAVASLPNAAELVKVTILNVVEKKQVIGDSVVTSEEWYDEEDFPPSVDGARDILEEKGISVEKRREHSDPTEAIIQVANEIDADRIVMAGRKRSPTGKVLFGSVTQSVLLNTDIPVTVVMD